MHGRHVIVIGAGIAGLAAARSLGARRGHCSVTLLESADRPGGCIRTEMRDGFTLELGPDSFLSRKPRGVGLCRELGLPLEGTGRLHRGAYLKHRGRLCRLPEGLSGLVPSRLGPVFRSPLLSARGKARFALEYVIPARRRDEDESVSSFFTRRIGREATARIVEPLLGGIYGGDGRALSLRAAFPDLAVVERRFGSLLRGLKRRGPATTATPFVAPRGGMERLVERLCGDLGGAELVLRAEVTAVEREGGSFVVRVRDRDPLRADAVVVAAPAPAAARLLQPLDADLADAARSVPYGSVTTLSMAYRARDVPRALDAYGYIAAADEGDAVVACTFASSKFPGRAPDGAALLRLFLGHSEAVFELDDDAVVRLGRRELASTLGITAPPLFARLHRMERVMPRYAVGHLETLARLDLAPGLRLAGAAWRGVGIPDCIRSGERAANEAAEYLSTTLPGR